MKQSLKVALFALFHLIFPLFQNKVKTLKNWEIIFQPMNMVGFPKFAGQNKQRGWMVGWVNGWMDVKTVLRIGKSNQ